MCQSLKYTMDTWLLVKENVMNWNLFIFETWQINYWNQKFNETNCIWMVWSVGCFNRSVVHWYSNENARKHLHSSNYDNVLWVTKYVRIEYEMSYYRWILLIVTNQQETYWLISTNFESKQWPIHDFQVISLFVYFNRTHNWMEVIYIKFFKCFATF